MWDNDIGLILGTVLVSSLLFASEKHGKSVLTQLNCVHRRECISLFSGS